jgi:tetratricopeptide (TPR) repeat protein
MPRSILHGAVLVGLLLLSVGRAEAGGHWLTRLDEAERRATASGKDLFIVFTGTEWCEACTDFENVVLSTPDFVRGAEPFILVKFEFPASDTDLPPDRRADFIARRNHYGIRAFPTVLLADAAGRPYAVTGHVGHKAGEYVRHLDKLREVRAQRDAALSKAANARGVEKARHLDVALSAVQAAFDKGFTELNGDMLLRIYRPEIEQIIALDPKNSVGLREKYLGLLRTDSERERLAAIDDQFAIAMKERGANAAIELVDRELERATSSGSRKRLKRARLFYLEWGDRYEDALACATDLANDDSNSPEERRSFQSRIAFNLMKLRRIEEAVTIYDRLIAEVSGNHEAAWRFLRTKADMLTSVTRLAEALEAWDASRRFVKPGTEHWLNTEVFRSRLLGRLGRQAEAIAGLDAALSIKSLTPLDRAILLAEKAIVLSKAAQHKEADAIAEQVEKVLQAIGPDSSSESARGNIRDRMRTMRGDAVSRGKEAVPRNR